MIADRKVFADDLWPSEPPIVPVFSFDAGDAEPL